MKKITIIIACVMLSMLLFYSCSSTIKTMSGTSLVTITIGNDKIASLEIRRATLWAKLKLLLADVAFIPAAHAYIPSVVQSIRVTVSAPDMTAITKTADVAGQLEASITIEVPNGQARYFVVDAYDASKTLLYTGSTYADMTGTPVTLAIRVVYAIPKIFVANSVDNTVSVIDPATDTVVATIPVGSSPAGVVVNPATARAYVANRLGNTVSVIDITNNTLVNTINVLITSPTGLGIDASIDKVFVSNDYSSNSVDYIDVASGNTVGTITFGAAYGQGVAANPVTHKAYATDWGTVYVIDTLTNTTTGSSIAVGGTTVSWFGVAVNSATNRIYVTDTTSTGQVFVIDGNTDSQIVAATMAVGMNPEGIAIHEAASRAYVANSGGGTVSVIDTTSNTVVTTITVGITPMAVAVQPSANRAYVTNSGSGTVSVIDTTTNTVVKSITVGTGPLGIAVNK